MEFKNRVIRVENIPKDPVIYQEKVKPAGLLILIFIVGLVTYITGQQIIGILLCVIAGYGLFFVPGNSMIDFTKRFIILRNPINPKECTIIYWKEIVHWEIVRRNQKSPQLRLILDDGEEVLIEIIHMQAITKLLSEYVIEEEGE